MAPLLLAAAAAAQGWSAPPFPATTSAAPSHVGGNLAGDWRRGGDGGWGHHHHHRHPRRDRVLVVNHGGWGGALSHDPASAWRSNGYNDWWHDQPWRSYPRWVQQQQQGGAGCPPERMWQSGGVWRC